MASILDRILRALQEALPPPQERLGVVQIECLQGHGTAAIAEEDGRLIYVACNECEAKVEGAEAERMFSELLQRAPHWVNGKLSSIDVVTQHIGKIDMASDTGQRWPFGLIIE